MPLVISEPDVNELSRLVSDLGHILHACVLDGASVGYILPFTEEEAEASKTRASEETVFFVSMAPAATRASSAVLREEREVLRAEVTDCVLLRRLFSVSRLVTLLVSFLMAMLTSELILLLS